MGDDEKLRSALITWRQALESGNFQALCAAYEIGNDALGVPPELRDKRLAVKTPTKAQSE